MYVCIWKVVINNSTNLLCSVGEYEGSGTGDTDPHHPAVVYVAAIAAAGSNAAAGRGQAGWPQTPGIESSTQGFWEVMDIVLKVLKILYVPDVLSKFI